MEQNISWKRRPNLIEFFVQETPFQPYPTHPLGRSPSVGGVTRVLEGHNAGSHVQRARLLMHGPGLRHYVSQVHPSTISRASPNRRSAFYKTWKESVPGFLRSLLTDFSLF